MQFSQRLLQCTNYLDKGRVKLGAHAILVCIIGHLTSNEIT